MIKRKVNYVNRGHNFSISQASSFLTTIGKPWFQTEYKLFVQCFVFKNYPKRKFWFQNALNCNDFTFTISTTGCSKIIISVQLISSPYQWWTFWKTMFCNNCISSCYDDFSPGKSDKLKRYKLKRLKGSFHYILFKRTGRNKTGKNDEENKTAGAVVKQDCWRVKSSSICWGWALSPSSNGKQKAEQSLWLTKWCSIH